MGSLVMDYAECVAEHLPTWDERLAWVHGEFQHWCKQHGVRPSTVDDLSFSRVLIERIFFGTLFRK